MGWIHLQKRFRLRTDPGNGPICEAAYMGGEKAHCEFTGKSVDCSDFSDILTKGIIVPDQAPERLKALTAPGVPLHQFGRMLEVEETAYLNRKHRRRAPDVIEALQVKAMTDARYLIALPLELPIEVNIELALAYLNQRFVSQDLAVCYAVNTQDGNPHLKALCSTRVVTPDGFGSRAAPFNRHMQRIISLREDRRFYAELGNSFLSAHGFEPRLDHRTYKEQGLELTPSRRRRKGRL